MHKIIHKALNFICVTVAGLDQHDSLTGLANAATIRRKLSQCLRAAKTKKQPLAVIIADIDRFKIINDTYGHLAGDRIIAEFARILERGKPENAHVGRMGGEEFMIVLPNTALDQAEDIADKLIETIRLAHVPVRGKRAITFRVSMGISGFPDQGSTLHELINRADMALYLAKLLGRDMHVIWSADAEERLEQHRSERRGEGPQPPDNLPIQSAVIHLVSTAFSRAKADLLTILGTTDYRYYPKRFGIRKQDRRSHIYVIGQTGTGKSTLLENMIHQDVYQNEGIGVFDPHGDFVEHILGHIPAHRSDEIVYFNVPDPKCPFGFNPLAGIPPERRALAASGMVDAFKKIWDKTWGARMEHILRNVFLTLLEVNDASFADVRRLFFDQRFRNEAILRLTNPEVRDFWLKEFASYPPRYRIEAVNPILNKVGAFLSDPNMNRVLAQGKPSIDVRKIMDEGSVLLVNLAKGKIGADNSALLGALLVSAIGTAAMSRADQPESQRRSFYLYLDEFQNFTTLTMANMLSELRKYGLSITMAHQYLAQLEEDVRDAVLGNVGTTISFRVGLHDAKAIKDQFFPKFDEHDLLNLPNFHIYIRMMIDGEPAKPFSAVTFPPLGHVSPAAVLWRSSQEMFGRIVAQFAGWMRW